jgi:NAD+-dependent protein deacetylase sirtuin 4
MDSGSLAAPGAAVGSLAALMRGRRTLVLSGAGISTESGIPDYRGPQGTLKHHKPMQYREFVGSAEARQRYWARSAVGWTRLAAARPNSAHRALADMERAGHLLGIITQNVDGLHGAAGSRHVLELHGTLALVRCLSCGVAEERPAFQARLQEANHGWEAGTVVVAPDGDAEIDPGLVGAYVVPACLRCGGVLKPDVVFFGENVPSERVDEAWAMTAEAGVLLVAGSSLAVYSGWRFVERAARDGTPIAIINEGETRGDAVAAVRIEGRLGDVLPRLAAELGA